MRRSQTETIDRSPERVPGETHDQFIERRVDWIYTPKPERIYKTPVYRRNASRTHYGENKASILARQKQWWLENPHYWRDVYYVRHRKAITQWHRKRRQDIMDERKKQGHIPGSPKPIPSLVLRIRRW